MGSHASSRNASERGRRELRCSLPAEKWVWLDEMRQTGVAETYSALIILALEALHAGIIQRRLQEARLKHLLEDELP